MTCHFDCKFPTYPSIFNRRIAASTFEEMTKKRRKETTELRKLASIPPFPLEMDHGFPRLWNSCMIKYVRDDEVKGSRFRCFPHDSFPPSLMLESSKRSGAWDPT